MKTIIAKSRRQAGVLLLECLVYIGVFGVITGAGLTAFYFCWQHSTAVVCATDDIGAALRAGEHWRADVRSATGAVAVETTANGQVVRIPVAGGRITYRFEAGEIHRETTSAPKPVPVLARVVSSAMTSEPRGGVTACRWELQLAARRSETQLPLLFTFEAAPNKP